MAWSLTEREDELTDELKNDYERLIGLADLLHEEITDLIHDRREILEEQHQHDSSGEEMDQDSLDFLST